LQSVHKSLPSCGKFQLMMWFNHWLKRKQPIGLVALIAVDPEGSRSTAIDSGS